MRANDAKRPKALSTTRLLSRLAVLQRSLRTRPAEETNCQTFEQGNAQQDRQSRAAMPGGSTDGASERIVSRSAASERARGVPCMVTTVISYTFGIKQEVLDSPT